ncbi:hypothetical protein DFH07DRAFT_1058328 [Mycena maculata]|uniref:Uncharacterized protein n=1 Tax=Mycena maculata TaxID=230809 RepID=A0AAD7NNU2_9AGAR|nr:hypothetical protein DFH07DRAFT_1058328 [Mycena maculata]
MTPCRNEGWVEAYATNIISLINCLIQGIWPATRVAEWPVSSEYSQQGDRHIVTASIHPYHTPQGPRRALAARLAIAGEWKIATVLDHHFSTMLTDHTLPKGEARDRDGILKKLGLHIDSTYSQCQQRNQELTAVAHMMPPVNVQYGIVFTGKTCLVSQAVPTPILKCCNFERDGCLLGGRHPVFETLRDQNRLVIQAGSPGMPPPPGPPQPPPGAPPSGGSGRHGWGGPGGSPDSLYPSGSTRGSGVIGHGYPSTSGQYGRGYSLQQMQQVLLHYVLSSGPGRPHIATLHQNLVARRDPNSRWLPIFDLEATESVEYFPLVDLNVTTNSKPACLTLEPFSKQMGNVASVSYGKLAALHSCVVLKTYPVKRYTIVVRELGANAALACLAIIVPTLYTVSNNESQLSAELFEGDGNPPPRNSTSRRGSDNILMKLLHSAINETHAADIEDSPKDVVRRLRGARCFCVVDGSQAILRRLVF